MEILALSCKYIHLHLARLVSFYHIQAVKIVQSPVDLIVGNGRTTAFITQNRIMLS